MRVFDKIREVGAKNTIVGSIKKLYYTLLRVKYGFLEWNTSPYELRKYIQDVAEYINRKDVDCIIDCGCGLGELLRHSKARKRIGIDRGLGEIRAAKFLDRTKQIEYYQGTLESNELKHMDAFLVTLGFTHGADEAYWRPIYRDFLGRNKIRKVIVDVFPPIEGQYSLDYTKILPESYGLCDRMGPYKGDKWIEIYSEEGG